jgi:tetratricopeptide (TPR) repeat protein
LSADNLFAMQDEIARQVVTMVADQYEGAINQTLVGEMSYGTRSLTGYDAILQLHQYNHVASHDAFVAARRGLEEAQAADPRCGMAWAGLAELQVNGYALGYNGADRDAALSRAFASVRRAMALAPDDDYIRFVLGLTHLLARDRTSLAQVAERLIKFSRQPSVQALAAWLLALAGNWERGTAMLAERMQALNQLPGWLYHVLFLNAYQSGDYEAAYQASLKFNMPMHFWDPLERAAALGQLGRTSEAQQAIGQMLRLRPDFADHPRRYLECYILQDELVDQVIDGLRKGGCCFN